MHAQSLGDRPLEVLLLCSGECPRECADGGVDDVVAFGGGAAFVDPVDADGVEEAEHPGCGACGVLVVAAQQGAQRFDGGVAHLNAQVDCLGGFGAAAATGQNSPIPTAI